MNFAPAAIIFLCGTASVAALDNLRSRRINGSGGNSKKYIVTFATYEKGAEAANCQALAQEQGGTVSHVFDKVLSGCALTIPDTIVGTLESNPKLATIEEDLQVFTNQQVLSWGLDRINQLTVPLDNNAEKVDASGVKVYIVDTGIQGNHPDFVGVMNPSSGCHSDKTNEGNALLDGNGHGTHVASITCGNKYGVAENCELCAVKVLKSNGSGYFSDFIAGINFVVNNCGVGNRCVVNASLGGGLSKRGNQAVANAVAAGVVVVIAAGNSNADACMYSPASEPTAITVGSTTNTDGISSFSNYGNCVDVYGPGSSITAAWKNGGTRTISGTSMASPHVAGIAAGHFSARIPASQVALEITSFSTRPGIDSRTPNAGLATIFSGATVSPTSYPTTSPPSVSWIPSAAASDSPTRSGYFDMGTCNTFTLLAGGLATCPCDVNMGLYGYGTLAGTGGFIGTAMEASSSAIDTCRNEASAIYKATLADVSNCVTMPALVDKLVITPGYYCQGGAISIAAAVTITLDSGGDANAEFVFTSGGAIAFGAGVHILLAGGATFDNIFWISTGAIAMGANSITQGIFITGPIAAFTLGANGKIVGRVLIDSTTTMGAGSSIESKTETL